MKLFELILSADLRKVELQFIHVGLEEGLEKGREKVQPVPAFLYANRIMPAGIAPRHYRRCPAIRPEELQELS
ncbi:hypothetical protein AIZ04_25435, partial [Salmonella enterica subsp. enterica serovar Typhimurium]